MLKVLMFSMMLWISDTTGLPLPEKTPTILYAEKEAMCTISRPGVEYDPEKPCGTVALYMHNGHVMVLPKDFDPSNLFHQAVLVHELTHHLQSSKVELYACSQEREKEAYSVHMEYLRKAGVEDPLRFSKLTPEKLLELTECPAESEDSI